MKVVHSTAATFVALSDPSGVNGACREQIRANPSWRGGAPRYDCMLVSMDTSFDGMLSMEVAQVLCFFSFAYMNSSIHSCALIHWFDRVTDEPDELTGMWMVTPSFTEDGGKHMAVIPVESIVRNIHLLPIFGAEYVPDHTTYNNSLDLYRGFYVNHFSDHHAFDLLS